MAEVKKVTEKKVTEKKEEEGATTKKAPPAQLAFMIEPVKKRKRYSNAIFYGDYGVGKTTLAASASEVPEMKDVIFINAEGGDESIKYYDLDLITISNFGQFARVQEYLRRHCILRDRAEKGDKAAIQGLIKYESTLKGVPEEEITEPKLYRTVVVDSLTEVQKYCMYQLLGIKIGEFALDLPPDQPEWSEWGKSAEMIRLLVRTFRDLSMNTIFVCGMGSEQDHQKRYHYQPLLPGKLANEILGFFDTVGFMTSGRTEGGDLIRRLYLEPGATFKAKNRFVNFSGNYIDQPTMADLFRLTNEQNK